MKYKRADGTAADVIKYERTDRAAADVKYKRVIYGCRGEGGREFEAV